MTPLSANAHGDYAQYLPPARESLAWGIQVQAAGRHTCNGRDPYPTAGHPADHAIGWSRGRTLRAFQIVYIAEGSGVYESRETGSLRVEAGTAMIILPGVWHRYRPDLRTGWTEEWVELSGSTVESLVRARLVRGKSPLIVAERPLQVSSLFREIHSRMRLGSALVHDPERAALGLQLLAVLVADQGGLTAARPMRALIGRAEHLIRVDLDPSLPIPRIAERLGIAYSYFRREFKKHTGFSPRQYANQVRLERARQLLATSDTPLKAISGALGFSSQYHLSTSFKKRYGIAPVAWRRQMRLARAFSQDGLPAS